MPGFLFEGNLVEFEDGETVLESLLRAGHRIESGCKAGACQSCLLRAKEGAPPSSQKNLDPTTIEAGGFLACQAKAAESLDAMRFDPTFFPTYKAILARKVMVSADVCLLSWDVPDLGSHPGRFIQLTHPAGVRRPYSIATSAFGQTGIIETHVRLLPDGEMSRLLQSAQVGNTFEMQGPFGKGFYRPSHSDKPLLLIGSGTGLAPLYAVACDALSHGHQPPIHLFHGSAKPEGLYFRSELKELEGRFDGFHYMPCSDQRAARDIQLGSPLTIALESLGDLKDYAVFLCGHPELVKQGQKKCFLAGASLKDIFADPFEPSK